MIGGLFVIFDGIGDLGLTPLAQARKPWLDDLAARGEVGPFWSVSPGIAPESDLAHLHIFGARRRPSRGFLEALGAGLKPQPDTVYFRVNFATRREGRVVDRRAGRLPTEEAKRLAEEIGQMEIKGFSFRLVPTFEHRGVLEASGEGVHPVRDTDPHRVGVPPILPKGRSPFERALLEFLAEVERILQREKANTILLRGGGPAIPLEPLSERFGVKAAAVAGGNLYLGIARYFGMKTVKAGDGSLKTPLGKKAKAVSDLLRNHDFVFLHLKGTDTASHDGNSSAKRDFIQRSDEALSDISPEVWAITGDHSTPVKLKRHSSHPCPYSLGPGFPSGRRFDEFSARKGLPLFGPSLFYSFLDRLSFPVSEP